MDESIKNAVKYISEILKENPGTDKLKLIDEASKKFDLNPMQTEFLTNKIVHGK
jgi:hypothetical protein